MGVFEDATQTASAVLKSLESTPVSYRRAALSAVAAKKARESIDLVFSDLYDNAESMAPKSVNDLEDPRHYAAACLMYMKHETKSRAKRDMLIHIGKIFGHDKRTIDIQDKRSYVDVLKSLQAEFSPVVDSTGTVKQVDAGS